jgi:hypothetical protein
MNTGYMPPDESYNYVNYIKYYMNILGIDSNITPLCENINNKCPLLAKKDSPEYYAAALIYLHMIISGLSIQKTLAELFSLDGNKLEHEIKRVKFVYENSREVINQNIRIVRK